MLTQHALLRVDKRLNGFDAASLMRKAESVANSNLRGGIALKLADLDNFIGNDSLPYNDRLESNGDTIWAIIREQSVVTYMLRRSDQPATPQAMRVDKILFAR